MLHPVIFIMAFPGEIMESGLIIHHTKYFIVMLLNSMTAACLQFIWVMVCIPNHSHLSLASGQRFPFQCSQQNYCCVFYNECYATWSSGCSIGLHHRCDSVGWHPGYRCSTMEARRHRCLMADVQQQLVKSCSFVPGSLRHIRSTS